MTVLCINSFLKASLWSRRAWRVNGGLRRAVGRAAALLPFCGGAADLGSTVVVRWCSLGFGGGAFGAVGRPSVSPREGVSPLLLCMLKTLTWLPLCCGELRALGDVSVHLCSLMAQDASPTC